MTPSSSDLDRAVWSLRAYETIALATVSGAGPHVAAFFFAPERTERGITLLIATPQDSRKLREIVDDPRVAFMCYPGNAARWVTGWGVARPLRADAGPRELTTRLVTHAPGARAFVEGAAVVAVEVAVARLEIVDAIDTPPRVLELEA